MTVPSPTIEEYGDAALLVTFGPTADDTSPARGSTGWPRSSAANAIRACRSAPPSRG